MDTGTANKPKDNDRLKVTVQSRTPSDPLRGPPPSKREAFGEQIRLIGSLLEGAGWPIGQTEGVLMGGTE